jgi:hypothetical protein
MASPQPIRVLWIPFTNFNTLHWNGLLEILENPALPNRIFDITIATRDDLTTAIENFNPAHFYTTQAQEYQRIAPNRQLRHESAANRDDILIVARSAA